MATGLIVDIWNAMNSIFGGLSASLIKFFIAILIFLLGFILGKIVGRFVSKVLEEIKFNEFVKKLLGLKIDAEAIISSFLSYIIYFLALIAAMEKIGVANIVLYIISFLLVSMLLISFFLAIKDFVPNFIAGIYLFGKDNLKKGAHVEIGDITGVFQKIELLHMMVETSRGDIIYIPNTTAANTKIILKKPKPNSKPRA